MAGGRTKFTTRGLLSLSRNVRLWSKLESNYSRTGMVVWEKRMLSDKNRILVLDSERKIAASLHQLLDAEEYHIENVEACVEALNIVTRTRCDVILLDLGGEALARIELMKEIRQACPEASMIITAARPTAASAIMALRHGVYDFLVKPIRAEDLMRSITGGVAKARRARRDRLVLARLHDLAHLLKQDEPADILSPGSHPAPNGALNGTRGNGNLRPHNITIDRHQRRVRRNGKWVSLTPTEFALLTHLVQHTGEVQEYRKLVREVQGYEADEWEARNLVKYYIHCLRKKLEPQPADPEYILNVRGVGYLFAGTSTQVS